MRANQREKERDRGLRVKQSMRKQVDCHAQLVQQVEQVAGLTITRTEGAGGDACTTGETNWSERQLISSCFCQLVLTKMKLLIVLLGLSTVVMVVMIFQAARQELNLRYLKTRTAESSAAVKRKEEAIIELKNKIKKMKETVESVNAKMDELRKKKGELEKSTQELGNSLQTCNTGKARDTHFQFLLTTGDI